MFGLFKSKKKKTEELRQLVLDTIAEEEKSRYESNEPWVKVISERFDPDNGVELKLDWNRAFIKYLKANGISGRSEDEIVDKWLRSISNNIPDADTRGFE